MKVIDGGCVSFALVVFVVDVLIEMMRACYGARVCQRVGVRAQLRASASMRGPNGARVQGQVRVPSDGLMSTITHFLFCS